MCVLHDDSNLLKTSNGNNFHKLKSEICVRTVYYKSRVITRDTSSTVIIQTHLQMLVCVRTTLIWVNAGGPGCSTCNLRWSLRVICVNKRTI
jgi:hypothetical protein